MADEIITEQAEEFITKAKEVVAALLSVDQDRAFALGILERFPDSHREPLAVCALVLALRALDEASFLTSRAIRERSRVQALLAQTGIEPRLQELERTNEHLPTNSVDRKLIALLARLDQKLRVLASTLVREHGWATIHNEYDASARARKVPRIWWWEYPARESVGRGPI